MSPVGRRGFLGLLGAFALVPLVPRPSPARELKALMDLQLQTLASLSKAFGETLPATVQRYVEKLERIPA